jgi:hypothetical protein
LEKVSGSLSYPLLNGSISLQLTAEEAVSDVVGSINCDAQFPEQILRPVQTRISLSNDLHRDPHEKRRPHGHSPP